MELPSRRVTANTSKLNLPVQSCHSFSAVKLKLQNVHFHMLGFIKVEFCLIAKSILTTVNVSLQTSLFPSPLKTAVVKTCPSFVNHNVLLGEMEKLQKWLDIKEMAER